MTEFYLVTGFLGAGKTTFLKNFIRLFAGKKLRLIINEFGREGVDGKLLDEVGATLREISGGSIFCSCRLDRFEEALAEGLAAAPDLLIVEASGLSDPTNIRRVLEQNEREGRLVYRGCICVADAARLHKVFATARVCRRQLAVSDLVLLNKTDIATPEQLVGACALISEAFPQIPLRETSHGVVERGWVENLNPYRRDDDPQADRPDITTQRAFVEVDSKMSRYELERFIAMFAEDSSRIKGFVHLDDSGWLLADCVGAMLRIEPWQGEPPENSGLNVLATAGMPLRKALKTAAQWYSDRVTIAG